MPKTKSGEYKEPLEPSAVKYDTDGYIHHFRCKCGMSIANWYNYCHICGHPIDWDAWNKSQNIVVEDLPPVSIADDLQLIRNCLEHMTMVYRHTHRNFEVVQDLLLGGTDHNDRTSAVRKCEELNIDPYGYDLKPYKKECSE